MWLSDRLALEDHGSEIARLSATRPGNPRNFVSQSPGGVQFASITDAATALPFDSIGRYQVTGRLGAGNFATVYRAYDPALDSDVAIKMLASHHADDPDIRSRFIQEARLLRSVGGDRLIGVHDIGEVDHQPYMVMELLECGTLADRLQAGAQANAQVTARLIDELEACLTAIHVAGVVHRDIKPSNVLIRAGASGSTGTNLLLGDDEQLVLGDFGLARELAASNLTTGGGTDGYMAPEQRTPSAEIDQRTDIFAASALLVTVLRNEAPAPITMGRPLRSRDLHGISPELHQPLLRGLEPDVDLRPASARAWASMLREAHESDDVDHLVSPSAPTSRTTRPSRAATAGQAAAPTRRMGLVAAIVAVLLAGGATLAILASGDSPSSGDIVGPTDIQVGETVVYRAEVPDSSTVVWTVNGSRVANEDLPALEVVADSAGRVEIELTERLADGSEDVSTLTVEASGSLDQT